MAHYLFTLWDGGGSLPPELAVVRQVAAAGHRVTVLIDPVAAPEARAAGATDVRVWTNAPHHTDRSPENDYIRDWEIHSPLRVLTNFMDTLVVRPAPAFAAEVLDAIDDLRPDMVVSSFPLFGAVLAAEVRRLPCAVLVPNVVSLPCEGMPPFGTGFLPPRGPIGRRRDRALNAMTERVWNKRLPELNQARTSLGLDPLDRDVHQIHRRDALPFPVLEDLEVLLAQIRHEAALLVQDHGVHLDEIHLRPERRGRRPLSLLAGASRDTRDTGESEQQQRRHDGARQVAMRA